MKKLLLTLALSLSIFASITPVSPAQAAERTTECKVNSIYYDSFYQAYYMDSTNVNDPKDGYIYYLFDKSTESPAITT